MEVAPPTKPSEAYALSVRESAEPSAPVVTQLKPRTQLHVLRESALEDGTPAALVALVGNSASPLGWVTARSAVGEAFIHVCARPLYVLGDEPLKVLQQTWPASRFVTTLQPGTKLHVLDMHRVEDGSQRVYIVPLGFCQPIGWYACRIYVASTSPFLQLPSDRPHIQPCGTFTRISTAKLNLCAHECHTG
jgi:hypothetical protein